VLESRIPQLPKTIRRNLFAHVVEVKIVGTVANRFSSDEG
jgi:hypothetical protein